MSELKSYEKIRESSHIHDCEWVVSDGKRVTCFNYELDDEHAKNIGECWRELADEVQSDIEKRDELIAALEAAAHVHTCRVVASSTENLTQPELTRKWYELSCGHSLMMQGLVKPSFCATCGAEVVGGV